MTSEPMDALSVGRLVSVCVGGALGSGARYLVGVWATRRFSSAFPYGTLIANAAGSLLLGALMYAALHTSLLPTPWRLALTVGFMGGFTTYSTFNYEAMRYVQEGAWTTAAAYVLLTLVLCWIVGAIGWYGARAALG